MTEIRVFPVWLRLLCSIFLLGVSLVRSEQLNTIEGQVFIRTNSGETIKLSLVTVLFFDEKTFSADLQKKREDALKVEEYYDPLKVIAQDSYNSELTKDKESREARDAANFLREIKAKADYTRSAKYLLGNLPQPLQSIKTDADGKFTFKATSGSYVLVAATNRATGARAVGSQAFPITESYYWAVKVTLEADQRVMLANDNLISSDSPASVIHTQQLEDYIDSSLTLQKLLSLIDEEKLRNSKNAEARAVKKEESNSFKTVEEAQANAVQLFPLLSVSGSTLNIEFLKRLREYKISKKEYFSECDWPVRLATECDSSLSTIKKVDAIGAGDFISTPSLIVPYNIKQRLAGMKISASATINYSAGTITDVKINKSTTNSALDALIMRHVRSNFRVKTGASGHATIPIGVNL